MNWRKRRFGLFLAAVVMPAALLAVLTFRFLRQDEELSRERTENGRRSAAEQAGRELAARLEAVQLQEVNRRLGKVDSNQADPPSDPAIIFAALWGPEGMHLPWESGRKPLFPNARLLAFKEQGEALEFRQR